MTASQTKKYLPAAGKDLFLPLYDPLTKLMGFGRVHQRLMEEANLSDAARALEIGCGTGTLSILLKQTYPQLDVVGLDPDPKALSRADLKSARAGLSIRYERGYADALPFADGSFDRVFSSMMYHHLRPEDRSRMLRETHRVLRPGGSLHMVDFSGESHGFLAHLLHSHRLLRDNAADVVLKAMSDAGFSSASHIGSETTLFGGLAYYRGAR